MQALETRRIAWLSFESLHIFSQKLLHCQRSSAECGQAPLLNFFLATPFRALLRRRTSSWWKVTEPCGNALEFQEVFMGRAKHFLQPLNLEAKNPRIFRWIDRKAMLMIEDAELSPFIVEHQLEVDALQNIAILVAE